MTSNLKTPQQLSFLSILSVILGFLLGHVYDRQTMMSSDEILNQVKAAFQREAPIDGAWISTHPSERRQFAIKNLVYYGGITRREDDTLVQYEFMADAKTGSVLSVYRL